MCALCPIKNVTLRSLSFDTHTQSLIQLIPATEELHTFKQLHHTEDTSLLIFLASLSL